MPLHCTSNELKVMNDAPLKNICFVFLGEEGRVFFLCLSLIKKAKTRICLYTENRLKKHLVCSMNRRNDYIKSTLK